ncbi:calcium/proton exchanger, partial [Imleria badia]
SLLKPEKKVGPPPTVCGSVRALVLSSYLNVLLIFIPISWALNFAIPNQHTAVFACSLLALIPLAQLLSFATEELSLRVGQTLAGLINATLIITLTKCQLTIVQSSLIGSILSNICKLLVLGTCFFAGGLRFSEQGFGMGAAQLNSSLLTISVIALLLPVAFYTILQGLPGFNEGTATREILKTSHGFAIILLFIYMSYLFFQLSSHKDLYLDDSGGIFVSKRYIGENPFTGTLKRRFLQLKTSSMPSHGAPVSPVDAHPSQMERARFQEDDIAAIETSSPQTNLNDSGPPIVPLETSEKSEEEKPQMSVAVSFVLLVVITVFVSVTANFLVDSIDGMTESTGISKEFVGVILLPIVGNAADHVTAVTVSVKDKLTLSLGVSVGSSIQIALFVIPSMVILGWMIGKPMTFLFDPLKSIVMFLSVLTVSCAVQDGKSNWLEGVILISLYLIACLTFFYYPGTAMLSALCMVLTLT